MEGREGVLRIGEDLLVEFFSGAEAGVFYLDVLVGFEACKAYHSFCKVCNEYGLAHIEDEYLVLPAHCGCFHHQAAGLWNGHEEAVDFRVSDGDGAALSYLLFEAWDYGAVGAKDVAESCGDKLCSCFS